MNTTRPDASTDASPPVLSKGEAYLLRLQLGRLYAARESGNVARIARVESRTASVLRCYPGRTFASLGYTWSVVGMKDPDRVRVVALVELD